VTTPSGAPANAAGTIIAGGYAPSAEVWYNGGAENYAEEYVYSEEYPDGVVEPVEVNIAYTAAVIQIVPFELYGPKGEQVTVDFAGDVSNNFDGNPNIGQGQTFIYGYDPIQTYGVGEIGSDNITFSQVDQLTTDTVYYVDIYANVGSSFPGVGPPFAYVSIDPTVTIDPTFSADNPDVTLVSDPGYLGTPNAPDSASTVTLLGSALAGLVAVRRRSAK
jgi:hypothetical protein